MARRLTLLLVIVLADCLVAAGAGAWPCESPEPLRPSDPPLWRLDVGDLKLSLQLLGYWKGSLDDCYCEAAVTAVKAFQAAHGLPTDGVVGGETWMALARRLEVPAPVPGPAPPDGAKLILIDTTKLTLTLYVDGQPFKTWPVAVGRPGLPTPVGEWRVRSKGVEIGGPFGSRWMGLNVPWGIYGIHGTNAPGSIGTRASKGCIRMHNKHVEELYPWIPLGTPVKIIGEEPYVSFERPLQRGNTGPAVVRLQGRLTHFSFDQGYADGRFGVGTERALRELQAVYGLPVNGVAGTDIFFLLGLR